MPSRRSIAVTGPRRKLACATVGILMVAALYSATRPPSPPPPPTMPTKDPLGIVWEAAPRNPQLVGDRRLSWHTAGATDPAIRGMPDGKLIMWFTTIGIHRTAQGAFGSDGPWIGRAIGLRGAAGIAVEPDGPVIPMGSPGVWDRYVETATVLPAAGGKRWTMWYLGYADRSGPTGFLRPALGQMVSEDVEGPSGDGLPHRSTGHRRLPGMVSS